MWLLTLKSIFANIIAISTNIDVKYSMWHQLHILAIESLPVSCSEQWHVLTWQFNVWQFVFRFALISKSVDVLVRILFEKI